jgi:transcription initiation factor TFIID subunit 6
LTSKNRISQNPTQPEKVQGNTQAEEEKKEEVKDDKVELKPLVKHVLSAELQMYYEKVIEVIKKEKRDSLLRSLSTDAGIQQLV